MMKDGRAGPGKSQHLMGRSRGRCDVSHAMEKPAARRAKCMTGTKSKLLIYTVRVF